MQISPTCTCIYNNVLFNVFAKLVGEVESKGSNKHILEQPGFVAISNIMMYVTLADRKYPS